MADPLGPAKPYGDPDSPYAGPPAPDAAAAHQTPTAARPAAAAQTGRTTHNKPKTDRSKASQSAHAGTKQGQTRTDSPPPDAPTKPPNYATVYGKPVLAEHGLRYPPNFKFLIVAANGKAREATNVINCSWEDMNAIMTGQIQFQEPAIKTFDPWVKPQVGDRVLCAVDVHDGQGFQEIWLMRLKTHSHQVQSMIRTFDMTNDLELANESVGNFFYAASTTKYGSATKKPGGWTGPQMIQDICHAYGIKVGQLYGSSWVQPKLHMKHTSPLAAIRNIVMREWRHKHRRLVVRFDKGELTVLPMARSPLLRQLGPSLMEAVFKEDLRTEFMSAALIYGIKEMFPDNFSLKKKKRNRMVVLRKSQPSISRFGYVQKVLWSPDARSDAALQTEGDAYLSTVAKPHRTLELTAPGIAYLRRGDAITLALGTDGLRKQLVWVDTLTQTVSPNQFISTIEVIFDDPYILNSELLKVWKLKTTRDEAIGNRARTNPYGWYLAKNNKGDGNQQAQKQQVIFNSSGTAIYGDPTAQAGASGGAVTFGGG